MNKYKKERKKQVLSIVHELQGIGTEESMRVAADYAAELEKMETPRDWLRVVWYSDECGGRLVRFKTGCPYGRDRSKIATVDDTETLTSLKTGESVEVEDITYCPINRTEDAPSERENKRLAASLSRTRRRIYEIAACNEWTWFFTGTLNGEKCDRNDLNGTFKRLSQFVRDFRKSQSGARIVYMIVPEQHKDGTWHFHGLLQGISEAELYKFSEADNIPAKLKKRISEGEELFTWKGYEQRFGWATLSRVKSHAAVSKYVTKYITKDLQDCAQVSGAHLYYASKGLRKPEVLAEGTSINGLLPYTDFENEWVALRSLSEKEEAEAIITRYIKE